MSTVTDRRPPSRRRALTALVVAAGLVVGTAATVAPVHDRPADAAEVDQAVVPTLDWQACSDDEPALPFPASDCAEALVPLDHSRPDGTLISIALERVSATGTPGERIGTVFLNPGGPGGSGAGFASYYASRLSPEVRRAFDVVGFDPRGVGRTSPQPECTLPGDPEVPHGTATAEWAAYMTAAGQRQAPAKAACMVANAHWFSHAGTVAVARDLDLLRAAVGDDQLTFHGISYGTRLGSVYAQLYPQRVRAMVLDGNMDPFGDVPSFFLRGEGYEAAFTAFRAWAPDAGAQFDEIQAVLADGPFSVPDGDIDSFSFRNLVSGSLGDEQSWPGLAVLIGELHHVIVEGGDIPVEPTPDELPDHPFIVGGAEDLPDEPLMELGTPVFWAVMCQDNPARPSAHQLATAAVAEVVAAPRFGYQSGGMASLCMDSPVPVRPIPRPTIAPPTVPLLVVQSRHDPQTPFPWGESMLSALAEGSRMVVYEGATHGMYAVGGSACVDAVGDAYLLHGSLPGGTTSCAFVPPSVR